MKPDKIKTFSNLRGLSLFLVVCLFFGLLYVQPVEATEKHRIAENLSVYADDHAPVTVRTLHYNYTNNRYLSLRDLAMVLKDTPKAFSLEFSENTFTIHMGGTYSPVGGENEPFVFPSSEEEPFLYSTKDLSAGNLAVNGGTVKYYSFLGQNSAGKQDCFVGLADLALILDTEMYLQQGALFLMTDTSFSIDLTTWEEEGFFQEARAALVGDATTGDIYHSYMAGLTVPIASTTKLMTYLCIMNAITKGLISMNDTVVISQKAAELSQGEDGTVKMTAGQTSTVEELLYGMLLPSSNECALALAEYTSGSEEAFVEQMNDMAVTLGLSDAAWFYNPHGLPVYSDNIPATKLQNHMTASDLFKIVSHILTTYPQITKITSTKEYSLSSFGVTVKNTNPLLYNMKGVVGLKTGTTNMAGACLVSAMEETDENGNPHMLVAIELGGEDGTVRCTMSQILLTYAKQVLHNGMANGKELTNVSQLPTDAEDLIRMVIRAMD